MVFTIRYRGFRLNMFPWSIIQFCDLKWLQSGAPVYDSVQLVQITPITMVYGTYNYSIHGVYKPTNITGGAHFVCVAPIVSFLDTHGRSENWWHACPLRCPLRGPLRGKVTSAVASDTQGFKVQGTATDEKRAEIDQQILNIDWLITEYTLLINWGWIISGWWCNNHLEKYESQCEGLHLIYKMENKSN